MATNPRKTRSRRRRNKATLELVAHVQQLSDYQRVIQHARENPTTYATAIAFAILCASIGGFYSLHAKFSDREAMTEYAKALETDDPALQAAALERLAERDTRWTAEVAYVMGEAAIRAEEYKKAEEAFTRVREEFGDSQYAPLAADGLAFLAENRGDFEEALGKYREVAENWPDTFAGWRQYLNIGRVHESLGDFQAAKDPADILVSLLDVDPLSVDAVRFNACA